MCVTKACIRAVGLPKSQVLCSLLAARLELQAMRRDTKLNSMLLPASKLQKMLQSYKTHGRGAGVDFRTPKLGHRSKPRR